MTMITSWHREAEKSHRVVLRNKAMPLPHGQTALTCRGLHLAVRPRMVPPLSVYLGLTVTVTVTVTLTLTVALTLILRSGTTGHY